MTFSIPQGAAIKDNNLILVNPLFLIKVIAAEALPPVANAEFYGQKSLYPKF